MIAGKYNMICQQGSTFTKTITYKIDGVAVDLTNYTARMQVREKHTSADTIVNIDTENGGIVIDAQNGVIQLNISAIDTSAIFGKTYVYDLELVDGIDVQRILEGNFVVTPEVTK